MKNNANKKKKSHKKLWIILSIVAVVVIILVVLAVKGLNNMAKQLTTVMNHTATAEEGEIEVLTEGTGVVETAESKSMNADYTITLRKLYKQDGEKAAAGEVIAEFDSLVLDDTIAALETQLNNIDNQLTYTSQKGRTNVTSPVSGRVKRIFGAAGDSVLTLQQQNGALAEISADGKLKVPFTAQADVVLGQKVNVLYGETMIAGTISAVTGKEAVAVFEDAEAYDVEVEVSIQAEDGTLLGKGMTACGHGILITADSGTVKSVSVSKNQKISAGDTIMRLENVSYSQEYLTLLEQREYLADKAAKAREYKDGYRLIADRDGIVNELTMKEGETITAGTPICRILDTSAFQTILNIDELDIQGIETGQPVEVTIDAIEDTVYPGTVSGISLAGSNENGVGAYQVKVLLENSEGILPGMSANGKITIDKKSDALLIPIDTIQTVDGEKKVTVVKKDGTTESRKVTLGLVNNDSAEVLEGVAKGEKLQVIVKLEDIYSQMGITMEEPK